ncbi:MAG: dihydrodipicolinate synthase family protein [Acidobacteriia bacterium]|nr:dihydrodipicolinate synthase family protein [Terriglobia bacterium]
MAQSEPLTSSREARARLTQRLFPQGLPRLWCPTLTHFAARGEFDGPRIRRHLQVLSPYVKGVLVPGSTGEGWEMSDADIQRLLEVVLDAARAADIRVLIGVLKTDLPGMLHCLDATVAFLQQRAGVSSTEDALQHSNVVGFTVCPPKGSHLDQEAIAEALANVAGRGLPLAFYQLPQVTGNEMSPETVQKLAAQYPEFYLFKDTSGKDRVAESKLDFEGVFLVRGAEGDYARWTRTAGGPYDGFLLSTANVFAHEFDSILRLLEEGRRGDAEMLASRLSRVVQGCFEMVGSFPAGNAFTNANKVLDHLLAYGAGGVRREPPLLYSGVRLPAAFVEKAAALLRQANLMPTTGYLE